MHRLWICLIAIAAVACGGGGASTGAAPSAAAPAASAPGATATQATAGPASSAPAAKGPSFSELAGASKNATYKVTYRWTGTGEGASISAEQTWYVRGSSSRFDLTTKEGSISLFDLAEGAYMCTGREDDYTYKTEWVCLGAPKDVALQNDRGAAFTLQAGDRPDAFDPTYEGQRTIAGQAAQCFGVKGKAAADFSDARICYSSGGIPLLIQQKGPGFDMTFEATAFTTTVTDADLKLPAAPTKLGVP